MVQIKKIVTVIGMGSLLLGGTLLSGCTTAKDKEIAELQLSLTNSQENVNGLTDQIMATEDALADIQGQVNALESEKGAAEQKIGEFVTELTTSKGETAATQEQLANKELELKALTDEKARLEGVITDYKTVEETVATEELGHRFDELFFGEAFEEQIITDRDVTKLLDTEIEFDDDDYDIHEELVLNGRFSVSGEGGEKEFADNPYFAVNENDINYRFKFDDAFDYTKVSEDEPLEIVFLGKPLKITKITEDKIVASSGDEKIVAEGETFTYGSDSIKVEFIGRDDVKFSVNGGQFESGEEDDVLSFDNFKIKVVDIMENEAGEENGGDKVEILIGPNAEQDIDADEEYLDNEEWTFRINADENDFWLGLDYAQNRDSIDEDEDYKAIALGESITLPNDYLAVEFYRVTTPDKVTYRFDDREDEIKVIASDEKGFLVGNDEYKKVKYKKVIVRGDGIYDTDGALLGDEVFLFGDSNLRLTKTLQILDKDDNVLWTPGDYNRDETVLTAYGINVENSDDWDDNGKARLDIPEERVEAEILVK